ncbi:MAG: NAD-dependent epimerase/dehydratase family protein [Gemmataceae bacterium]
MRCVVTGAAGFIGSHLCEELLRRGHTVVGIDSFNPYYSPTIKANNQATVLAHPQYHFHAADLRHDDLAPMVTDADYLFHLAAMPGLALSWTDFDNYWTCNVQATQRLLDAVRHHSERLQRVVLASTSSVYGKLALGGETIPTKPISPYGVTKLAAEQLSQAYLDAYAVPVVTLRFFSVYGPRQRPDMAYSKFIQALLHDEPVRILGDGLQLRGNTYVGDVVTALLAAMKAPVGETYNVGGSETSSVLQVLSILEEFHGGPTQRLLEPERLGDQRQTMADTTKIRAHLGWTPQVSLRQGLRQQWDWHARQFWMDQQPPTLPRRKSALGAPVVSAS